VTEHQGSLPRLRPFVVEPPDAGLRSLPGRLRAVLESRELLAFLAWRDLTVRYKQTTIGLLWAVVQPLLITGVFTIFFSKLGGIPSDGVPYALWTLVALIAWQVVSFSVTASSLSVVQHQELLKRVYFPRLLIPLAPVAVALADFVPAFGIAFVWLGLSDTGIRATILFIPLFLLLAIVTAIGVGCWLAALNVRFRDVQVAVPVIVQIWFFLTPIAYPTSIVPESWRPVFALNPMVTVVNGFRASAFGRPDLDPASVAISVAVALLLFAGGVAFFWKSEDTFADVV
jgi:lipopolysaccharide transport system permease protein